jgi:hypothetical protein
MRHAASFTSTGTSAPRHRSSSRSIQHRLSLALSSGVALFTVLVAPRTCEAAVFEDDLDVGKHRPQSPSLQATLLPEPAQWLQGERLRASLADGMHIEITRFDGDVVHAHALDGALEPGTALRLHPADLVGMQWTESRCERDTCSRLTFRIASAAPDETENTMPEHASNRDTWLYRVEHTAMPAPEEHDWQDACADEAGDSGMGLFVDGRWGPDGTWQADGYTFSCPRGVIAKCARSWGYKPWKTLASDSGPVFLHSLHLACTRAARADYCGDGIPHTREGVLIGMTDGHGFNPRSSGHGDIEAIFDEQGAIRVHGWRIPDLEPACRPARGLAASAADIIEVWR